MSLKIDLGLESKSYRTNGEVSPYDALLGVAAAQEALTRLSMEESVLTKSMEETEAGLEFARSVKDATSNDKIGLAVAKESISRSLGMIGNESIATSITAGATDLNGVVAATENVFKKMWEKAKEYAKKIWEWIRNLIAKAVDFVKGIFGKNGDVASDVLEQLKKLEKEKRTNLEDDKFPEAVRNRLAPKVAIAIENGSDLTTSVMKDFLTDEVDKNTLLNNAKADLAKLIAAASDMVNAGMGEETDPNPDDDKTKGGNEGRYTYGNESGGGKNEEKMDNLSKAIAEFVPSKKEVSGDVDSIVKDAVEDISGIENYKAEVVGKLPNKLIAVVIYTTDKYSEKMAEYEKDKKLTTLKNALNEVKVTKIEASIPEKDALDNAEHIIPIDFNDAKSFAETLKDRLKKEISGLDKMKKTIDNEAKDAIKKLDGLKKDNSESVTIYTKIQNFLRDAAKIIVEGSVAQANANVRNEFMTIIKESMRLYKKA